MMNSSKRRTKNRPSLSWGEIEEENQPSSASNSGVVSSMISYTSSFVPSMPDVSNLTIISSIPGASSIPGIPWGSNRSSSSKNDANKQDDDDDALKYGPDEDRPISLEGTLSFRKCRSSKDSKSWKQVYVVLNLTNEGSLSCYAPKGELISAAAKKGSPIISSSGDISGNSNRQEQNPNNNPNSSRNQKQISNPINSIIEENNIEPKLYLPPHVNWVAKDIQNNATGFIIEINSDEPAFKFVGDENGGMTLDEVNTRFDRRTSKAMATATNNGNNIPAGIEEDDLNATVLSDEYIGPEQQTEVPVELRDDIQRARDKGDNFRIYFKCVGHSHKGNEKVLWLRAFEQIDRLSFEIHEPKSLLKSLTLQNPNLKIKHSRIRSSHAHRLADAGRAFFQSVGGLGAGAGAGSRSVDGIGCSIDGNISMDGSIMSLLDCDHSDPGYALSRERIRKRNKSKTKDGKRSGEKEYMVYPLYAYPNRWMTDSELYMEMLKPSEAFHDTRPTSIASQQQLQQQKEIGILKVELLQCTGLPALDFASETDAVAYMVCGSHAFTTDVIWNRLNPMWLPRSRRACTFPLFHGYARLFVGIFDDDGKGEKDDFAGRVVIDLARCRPKSMYDITIPLRLSTTVYSRRPRGSVRLRFSLEWYSERAALLSYIPKKIRPPTNERPDDDVTVLCADEKAFRNIVTTVHGIHMPGRFSFSQWKAVMREAAFVRKALENMIRALMFDIVIWSNPSLSMIIFSSWMYMVYKNSFSLVPLFLMSFLLLMMIRTYVFFGTDGPIQQGLIPPSWEELAMALLKSGRGENNNEKSSNCIEPLKVKPTKVMSMSMRARHSEQLAAGFETHKFRGKWLFKLLGFKSAKSGKGPDHYHMEFPFSQGLNDPLTQQIRYPRFGVKESLVAKSSLMNRKSKSGVSVSPDDGDGEVEMLSDDIKSPPSTILAKYNMKSHRTPSDTSLLDTSLLSTGGDASGDGTHGLKKMGKMNYSTFQLNVANEADVLEDLPQYMRIPEQNVDEKGPAKKKKLSDELEQLRNNMHKMTCHIFNDRTHVIRHPEAVYFGQVSKAGFVSSTSFVSREKVEGDLERLLNVGQHSSANPVVARVGTYVQPIIHASYSGLGLYRAIYNIATWRDPMLSFWVSIIMAVMVIVSAIFPWRIFFFVLGIGLVGPQNWLIRLTEQYGTTPKFIKKRLDKLQKKKKKPQEPKTTTELPKGQPVIGCHTSDNSVPATYSPEEVDPRVIHQVSVPYSQLMTQRFYDWPPEPQYVKCDPMEDLIKNKPLSLSRHGKGRGNRNLGGFGGSSHHHTTRRGLTNSSHHNERRGLTNSSHHQDRHREQGDVSVVNRRGSDGVHLQGSSLRQRANRRGTG